MAPVKGKAPAPGPSKGKAKATGNGKAKGKTTASAGVQSLPTPPTRQTRQARRTQLSQQMQQAQQAQQTQRPPAPTHTSLAQQIRQTQRPPAPTHTQFEVIQPVQQESEPLQLQNIESFLQPQPPQQMQFMPHQSFQQSWNLQSPTFSTSQDVPQFQQFGNFGNFGSFDGMQQDQHMPCQSMSDFQGMQQPQQSQYTPYPFFQGRQQPQQSQYQSGYYFDQPPQMQPQQMQRQSIPFLQQSPFMQQQLYSPIQQPYSPMQRFPQRQSQLFPAFEQIQPSPHPLQQQSPPIFQGNLGQARRPQISRRSAATFINLADEDDKDEEDGKDNADDHEEEEPPKRPARNKRLTSPQSGETSQQRGFTFKQTETQKTQKKRVETLKRRAEGDEEEDGPRKKKKMGRPASERNGRCDQCFEKNIEDCDWKVKRLTGPMECTQCSEFRLSSGNIHHTCTAPGYGDGLYRDYSVNHPMEYPDVTCIACAKRKRYGKCDIDMLLGYSCTWANKKVGACKIEGSDIGFARRPGHAAQVKRWFRRACDSCHSRALTAPQQAIPCSWLKSRDQFGSACKECKDMGITCFDGVNIVEQPSPDPAQNSDIPVWNFEFFGHKEGFVELSRGSRGRHMCQQCDEDGSHCRISPRRPWASCSRCSTLGIDCIEKVARGQQAREFPIHSLATVGFGTVAPFHSCQRCIEMGRNCDRQRPCDSCMNNDEGRLCDVINNRAAFAPNGQAAGKKNVFRGRLANPGPLYYLAMGYGPGGVDDRKDGSQLEHWYGPLGPIYARTSLEFAPNGHVCDMQSKRNMLRPDGPPPQGLTTADMPSRLTVDRLRQLLITQWPNATPMDQHQYWDLYGSPDAWAACVAGANRRDQEAEEKAQAKRDGRTTTKKPKKKAESEEEIEDDENTDVEDEDGEGEDVDSSLPLLGGDAIDLNSNDNAMVQQTGGTQAGTELPSCGNELSLENYELFTALTEAGLDGGKLPAPDANGDEDVDMMG